jgi:Holliday junction resolvase
MSGPEKNFEERVKKYLIDKGAYVRKMPGGSQMRKGTPDIFACYKGRFIALETKAPKGDAEQLLQIRNLEWIREAGGYARFLFPDDFEEFKKELEDMVE